jgi:flavodoxin
MSRTLIVYWSGYGHTRRIVERLRDRLSERGEEVVTATVDGDEIDPSRFATASTSRRCMPSSPGISSF